MYSDITIPIEIVKYFNIDRIFLCYPFLWDCLHQLALES